MKVWKLRIKTLQHDYYTGDAEWVWQLVGYMNAEDHKTVEKRLNKLAAKHNTQARATLEAT